jgi:hypothetical protein
MELPRFMVSSDLKARGITRVGTIKSTYRDITARFGTPSLSEAAGDSFDGFETVVWKIKFENNLYAEISDTSQFGVKSEARECTEWAIYGHEENVVHYIKEYLRK